MTNNKIQLEVCKAMLNSNRMLAIAEISDEIICVSLNGFIAYALNKNECIFNTDRISKEHSEEMKKVFEPNEKDKIILKWCKEHPVETRQDRFLKMFPNAEVWNKVIKICPNEIDMKSGINCGAQSCDTCRKNYWLAEVEE